MKKKTIKQILSRAKSETFTRELSFSRADNAIDEEARTVAVAFSSEAPYERYFGNEILDHSDGSVRLGRLQNDGAVLVDHDRADLIGVVETVSLDKDKRGRALLRFGKSDRAAEIFQDVIDGIRTKISVGYKVYEMVLEKSSDLIDDYRVTDWEPMEISFVSIPADDTVGMGRSDENETIIEDLTMKTPEELAAEESARVAALPPVTAPAVIIEPVNVEAQRTQARKDETERMREVSAIASEFDLPALGQEAIERGDSVDVFRQAVLAEVAKRGGHKPGAVADVGLDTKDLNRYSFLRAIAAAAYPSDRAVQEAAGFELEVSRESAKRSDTTPQGILIPPEILARDLNVTTPADGGNLVATNLLSGSFIDLLRNRSIMAQLGGTILDGLVGNISVPKQTGAGTAYWLTPEGTAPTESQQSLGQVAFTPKTLGAWTDYTRQFLLQSSISAEAFVRNDLVRIIALAIDLAQMYGSGAAGQPKGIVNQTGIGSVTFVAPNAPTFGEVVDLESAVAVDNADIGTLGYAMHTAERGYAKQTVKFTNTGQTIWEPGNTVNGYATGVSNQMTAGDMVFGNYADAILALWGGLDLMVDPYSQSTTGGTRIVAFQSVDCNVRNVESFALGN